MANTRSGQIAALEDFFSVDNDDGPVAESLMQAFLDGVAEVHFMPDASADGRAAAVLNAGYTSKHEVASLTLDELRGLGFKPGNAKRIASYLGAAAVSAGASAATSQQQSPQSTSPVHTSFAVGQSVRRQLDKFRDQLDQSGEELADRVGFNELSLQSLQRQIAGRVRIASEIEEGNQLVEISILTKAFAIFVAFQIQLYFYEQVMLHSNSFEKTDKWDVLWVRAIWMGVVTVVTPWTLWFTRHRVSEAIFVRGIRQNARILIKGSAPMLFVWAFKDTVAALLETLEDPKNCSIEEAFGSNATDCERTDFESRCVFLANITGYALGAAATHLVIMKLAQQCKGGSNKVMSVFTDFLLNTAPFALGVGYGFNHALGSIILHFCLEYLLLSVGDDSSKEQTHFVTLLMILVKTLSISFMALKLLRATESHGAPATIWESSVYVLKKGLTFTAAWGWSELGIYLWEQILFDCGIDGCLNDAYSVWIPIAYAILITLGTMEFAMRLRFLSNLVNGIDKFYVCTLLPNDKRLVKEHKTQTALFITMVSIVVGWAWNDVVSSICRTNQTWRYAVWAVVVLVAIQYITFMCHHLYIERQHLAKRVEKVGLISRRQTERLLLGDQALFFGPGDAHHEPDDCISRENIVEYASKMGFETSMFLLVFSALALSLGKERIPIAEFAREFDDFTDARSTESDLNVDGNVLQIATEKNAKVDRAAEFQGALDNDILKPDEDHQRQPSLGIVGVSEQM